MFNFKGGCRLFHEWSSFVIDDQQILQAINDSVYELHMPPGRPSVDIVFFHGLNLYGAADAYLGSWLSAAGTELWPLWILDDYPDARILLISYDVTSRHGTVNIYMTVEKLALDLIDAKVGQGYSPVVLVGHSIGCLVMKEVCIKLNSNLLAEGSQVLVAQNLLHNVKGLFYYACPHYDSEVAVKRASSGKGLFLDELTALTQAASISTEYFKMLRLKYGWRSYGLQEGHPTSLNGFTGFIVQDASIRKDVDGFYTSYAADHFSISQPASKTSSIFQLLLNFIADMLEKNTEIPAGQIGVHSHSSQDDHPSPVKDDLEELCNDPITMALMCDPVKCSDGRTYCRWNIIDNSAMERCPYDRSMKLAILCDDITLRSVLFRVYPKQEEIFKESRNKYRNKALQDAHAGLVSAIDKLDNVLKWDSRDKECRNEYAKVLDLVQRQQSLLLLDEIPEVKDEDVAIARLDYEGARLPIFVMLFSTAMFCLIRKVGF